MSNLKSVEINQKAKKASFSGEYMNAFMRYRLNESSFWNLYVYTNNSLVKL